MDLWEWALGILEKLAYVGVGALAGFVTSWFLQKKAFERQRLDKAREKVYGPLSWELGKILEQVNDFGLDIPSLEADRVRNKEHLEWMIRSDELRQWISELYDKDVAKYMEDIRNLSRSIKEKLKRDISQEIAPVDISWKLDGVKVAAHQLMEARIQEELDILARALVSPVLCGQLPRGPAMDATNSRYQQLVALIPNLDSSLDKYFAKAIRLCEAEKLAAETARERLKDKIKKIQSEFERLLKPS